MDTEPAEIGIGEGLVDTATREILYVQGRAVCTEVEASVGIDTAGGAVEAGIGGICELPWLTGNRGLKTRWRQSNHSR